MWIIVGQGPIVLSIGAGAGCCDVFFYLSYHISSIFLPSVGDGSMQTENKNGKRENF